MRSITDMEKSEIRCDVSIRLTYKDDSEVQDRFSKLERCLKEKGLAPEISRGFYFGPSLVLVCEGTISLLDAEQIEDRGDTYVLPICVRYSSFLGFTLTNK